MRFRSSAASASAPSSSQPLAARRWWMSGGSSAFITAMARSMVLAGNPTKAAKLRHVFVSDLKLINYDIYPENHLFRDLDSAADGSVNLFDACRSSFGRKVCNLLTRHRLTLPAIPSDWLTISYSRTSDSFESNTLIQPF